MPQYLMSVWHDDDYDDNDWTDPEIQRLGAQVGALNDEMRAAGAWVFGAGLQPQSSATVVRAAGGDVSMTDGPYAETKEQMGGFWVIEAADLDAALEWAAQVRRRLRGPGRGPTRCRMADELGDIFRREAGRCTATLIRVLGDIDLAEDAVAEAFAIAAEQWPTEGVPPNPGGWITTTARNRAIDRLRRESTRDDRHLAAHRLHTDDMEPDPDPELDDLDLLRRRRPRRPAAADVPVLPPCARRPTRRWRSPCGSSAASTPPRSPGPSSSRGDDGPAHRAGQAQAPRQPRPLPRAPRRRAPRPPARGAGRRVPHLHRGPHGDVRPTLTRARPVDARPSAWAACSPSSCPTSPRPSGCSR